MIFGEGPIIKNIAGDLNKLFLQGSRVGQPVTNVEGDAAADQGTVDLLAAMDPVIQEVAVGMSGEESRQYTVSGTPPLALLDSLGMPLRSWSVEVSPYQEGTGDPSPSNVRQIHGTDKLTISTAGKNLCPSKLYQNSPTAIYVGQDNATDYPFALIAGQTYTISAVCAVSPDVYLREENDQQGVLLGNGLPKLFTPSVTGNYRIALAKGTGISVDDLSDVQLEFGSTATPYTPYLAPSQTVITLPQTVYTATIGESGGESRWGEVDLGTLNWSYNSGALRFDCTNSRIIGAKSVPNSEVPNAYCTQYDVVTYNDNYSATGSDNIVFFDHTLLRVRDKRFTDATAFKTAMQGVKLVYELATPTTFAVPSVTIPTPTGTATTWATAEDGIVDSMEVSYVGKA